MEPQARKDSKVLTEPQDLPAARGRKDHRAQQVPLARKDHKVPPAQEPPDHKALQDLLVPLARRE